MIIIKNDTDMLYIIAILNVMQDKMQEQQK